MSSLVMKPPVEILSAPKQLALVGYLGQQVTPSVPAYSDVTFNNLALHSLVLSLKIMGIAICTNIYASYQPLMQRLMPIPSSV